MDSLTPKTPNNICHTLCFMNKINIAKFIISFGGHLGFLPIKKVAQGCQSGNQARIVLEWPQNKNYQKKFIGKNISRLGNFQIDILTLWMLATFWTRSPSKIKSLRTFNTRSRHVFPIAILVLLLPKSSITKQVYSNSTFKVFHMIPRLATARIQNFFTLHVAI